MKRLKHQQQLSSHTISCTISGMNFTFPWPISALALSQSSSFSFIRLQTWQKSSPISCQRYTRRASILLPTLSLSPTPGTRSKLRYFGTTRSYLQTDWSYETCCSPFIHLFMSRSSKPQPCSSKVSSSSQTLRSWGSFLKFLSPLSCSLRELREVFTSSFSGILFGAILGSGSFFFLKPSPELFLLTTSIFFSRLSSSFFLNIASPFYFEGFFSSLEWLEWLEWVECVEWVELLAWVEWMSRSFLLMVFYFSNFSSWIFMVLEKSSFILAFIKGISRIFLMEGRLLGSLINISERSFLRSGEQTSGRGGQVPFRIFWIKPFIFCASKAWFSVAISQKIQPRLQMSLFWLQGFSWQISGERQQGVPIAVLAQSQVCCRTLAIPKSPIFISPLEVRKMFWVFRSRCRIFLSWTQFMARAIWTSQVTIWCSGKRVPSYFCLAIL